MAEIIHASSPVEGGIGHAEIDRTERRLSRLAVALDSAFGIPGTRIRFGADSLLGLLPGVGDAIGLAMSAYIVAEARRLGVPKRSLARMIGNIGIDAAVGTVPLIGDIFDVAFKANRKNMALLQEHLSDLRSRIPRDITPGAGRR